MISKSLVGKWFILRQSVGDHQIMLSRGRIAARVDEMFPVYLCEVWPHDGSALTGHVQMIVPLDDLKSTLFFDDEILWQENFRDIITKLEAVRKEAIARQRKAEKKIRKQNNLPDDVELVAVDQDQLEEILRRLQGGRGGDE